MNLCLRYDEQKERSNLQPKKNEIENQEKSMIWNKNMQIWVVYIVNINTFLIVRFFFIRKFVFLVTAIWLT